MFLLFKNLCTYIVPCLSLMVLCSCGEKYNISKPGAEEDVNIRLDIRLPSDMRQSTPSRGMTTEEESAIGTIDIYHFVDRQRNGTFQAVGAAPAAGVYLAGVPDRIATTLGAYPGKDSWLVFVANARQPGAYGYRAGMELEELLDALVFDQAGEWMAQSGSSAPLPMYGTTGSVTISQDIPDRVLSDNGEPFLLVRMHAKFNISLGESMAGVPFQLKSACVFNRMTQGNIPYHEDHWDTSVPSVPRATRPHIPSAAGLAYEPELPYPSVGIDPTESDYNRIINKIYIPEADNGAQSDRLKKTALVIGGIYGSDSEISYYRVDIDVTDGNILRNHLYEVDVQSVAGTGESTAIEAFEGISRLVAAISPWNLAEQGTIIEGPFRLDVDCDEIRFGLSGGEVVVTATTDYDKTDRGFSAGLYIRESDIQYTPSMPESGGWITLTDIEGGDGSLSRRFTITAAPNGSSTNRSAQVMLRAGNLTKRIYIGQTTDPE